MHRLVAGYIGAASVLLDGRAFHRPIATEHTAVARLGAKQHMARLTLVKEKAGIGGHREFSRMPTFRTGKN